MTVISSNQKVHLTSYLYLDLFTRTTTYGQSEAYQPGYWPCMEVYPKQAGLGADPQFKVGSLDTDPGIS